jgi:hypothetical protein
MAQMRRDWATFEARYKHLAEFAQMFGNVASAQPKRRARKVS